MMPLFLYFTALYRSECIRRNCHKCMGKFR